MRVSSDSPPWADHPELVEFYTKHRCRSEDLYPSERRFLPWLAMRAGRVLDVGCGAGGFRNIWCHYQPNIVYIGVDVSFSLIAAARRLYPGSEFHCGDCAKGLPFPDRYADVVEALGWLHWEHQYPEAIKELWRLTKHYLFFDVRLVAEPHQAVIGKQRLAFAGPWDGETTTPYICVPWSFLTALLVELQPATLLGYGYWGKPADSVIGVDQQICFTTFVLEKAQDVGEARTPKVCLDLPLAWPPGLLGQVELLPVEELNKLVPQQKI